MGVKFHGGGDWGRNKFRAALWHDDHYFSFQSRKALRSLR